MVGSLDAHYFAEKYCVFLLTIPCLTQRLPAVLISATRDKSILSPCFQTLLILKDKILKEMLAVDQSKVHFLPKVIPPVGWALANIICLATGTESNSVDPGGFNQDFDCVSYVCAINTVAEILLSMLENVDCVKDKQALQSDVETHEKPNTVLREGSDDAPVVPSIGSVTTPHVFPFEERVEMFREFIKMDKASRKMAGDVAGPGSRSVEIVVSHGHIVEDGFRQLNSLGSRLKSSIHVSFVSECGLPEAGLDYGGLSKEFLTDISKAAFAPDYGLFSQTSTSDRLLMPNASARFLENGIQMIEFLGRVVGKALYEGILLDYSFSHVFVQKLLGRYSFLDELSTLDPELYKNLMYVKHYDGDVEELCLDFTVTEESFGKRRIIELKPGGKDTTVTNKNKMQHIHAIADYKLNGQIFPFSNAFFRGLADLISPSWLKLFNAGEFNQRGALPLSPGFMIISRRGWKISKTTCLRPGSLFFKS